jgi:predicted GH43/DUF377 family glycosyl hydrolase
MKSFNQYVPKKLEKLTCGLVLIFLWQQLFSQSINLELMSQNFILETKKITIPGHPDAFNPSLVWWKDKLLMSFRYRDSDGSTNPMCIVRLNEKFKPVGPLYPLYICDGEVELLPFAQDPRLIVIENDLYVIYNNFALLSGFSQRRVVVGKIKFDKEKCYVQEVEVLTQFEGENGKRQEKNWIPFNYKGHLHLGYSIQPHRIFRPCLNYSGLCDLVANTRGTISWKWGEMRGGTQAYQVENEYLSFFHSSKDISSIHSKGKKISHYFIGAYTFQSDPPFAITKVSPEPIIAKGFYASEPAYQTWKPLLCVFPGGYIFNDKYIWVAYGRQDFEIWIMKLDRQKLLDSLTPIITLE